MTTSIHHQIREGYEPIPGYVLEEMIGRGGFGEVWRSSAPGGLKKAIKFVFGSQDSERAARERRSLERIKGVQHPFLLTLERFETIDGQLMIVTELADGSLEDVYKQNTANGSCGIARDVLIPHLSDAADALDYLHEEYQLQHLDIKPGNLLLVGGHVKVADFGLLKDLRDAECSIVGGLTPIYAPPELFDGQPNIHSDQYSLAVMYQELLTGTRPFNGRTIAQLATQHVHSAPNLEPLPPSDRPVLARALEKNPERRFASCCEFVSALRNPRNGGQRSGKIDHSLDQYAAGVNSAEPVEDLPQLDQAARQQSPSRVSVRSNHVLIVAIGGSGARCLRELRQRIEDQNVPIDLHSALIDTDGSTIQTLRETNDFERVPRCELIYTPLKSASEYRNSGTDRLKSISRRWIYNVPRSRTTEGMRPLGRLALVDHGQQVTQQLSDVIERFREDTGESIPRVYVVGSASGGTSSGMYIDAVHLLRYLMDEAGLEDVKILSLLRTSALHPDPTQPLALCDMHAALIEMSHYLKPGNGYSGDEGAGWPSLPAARTPLRDLYLIADSVPGSLTPPAVQTITEYIWSESNGAGVLFSAAREHETEASSSVLLPSVHSVGVIPLGDRKRAEVKLLSPSVAQELLVRWLGLPSKAREAAFELSPKVIRRTSLAVDAIYELVSRRLSDHNWQDKIRTAVADVTLHPDPENAVEQAIAPHLSEWVGSSEIKAISGNVISRLIRELSTRLSDRQADVTTIMECLKRLDTTIMEDLEGFDQSTRGLHNTDAKDSNPADADIGDLAIQATTEMITSTLIDDIRHCLSLMHDRLEHFATSIAMGIVQAKKLQGSESNPWDDMTESVKAHFDPSVTELHRATVHRYIIRSLVEQAPNIDASTMVNELHDAAMPIVASVFDDDPRNPRDGGAETVAITEDLNSGGGNTTSAFSTRGMTETAMRCTSVAGSNTNEYSIEEAVVAAKPSLLDLGGQQRLLLIVGTERERDQFEQPVRDFHQGPLNVAVIPGASPKLVHEAQGIELKSILGRLSVLNGDHDQITRRLSSRCDTEW